MQKELLGIIKLIGDKKMNPSMLNGISCAKCDRKMIWEHPNLPGHFMESSCYINFYICYDCMSEHCATTDCKNCEPQYKQSEPGSDNCCFYYLKE